MATVGEILKKARLEQKIELSEVERKTKIRSAFIEALEEGKYYKLPSATYARGFLTNYARFLGLSTEILLPLFRREFNPEPENKLLPVGLGKVPTRRIRVTLVTLLAAVFFLLFLSYFLFQYREFFSGPTLEVTSPQDNQILEGDTIIIRGKTDSDVQLVINNKIVSVSEDGSFEETILIFKGEATLTVVAKNRFGRENEIVRRVEVR